MPTWTEDLGAEKYSLSAGGGETMQIWSLLARLKVGVFRTPSSDLKSPTFYGPTKAQQPGSSASGLHSSPYLA